MADNPNLEDMLQMGITAAKEGNKEGARMLLRQVLDGDQKNDRAWVWMAYVAENNSKRTKYLETALRINPSNKAARKALNKIKRKRSSVEQKTLIYGSVFVLILLIVASLLCIIALVVQ